MKQIKTIKEAIKKEDIEELRKLAIKHGFINDKLRKKAWPLVLGIKMPNNMKNKSQSKTKQKPKTPIVAKLLQIPSLTINTKLPQIAESKTDIISGDMTPEYQQIEKDAKRSSLSYYNIKKCKRKSEASLSKILHLIFDHNDEMQYIQGFNDVASVFYAVCNNEILAQKISEKVAKTFFRDYIVVNNPKRSLLNIASYRLIFDIIECHDCQINKLFMNNKDDDTCTVGDDFVSISISWLLTWFAHNIKDINIISRIYDYCLCSSYHISSYLCAALIVYLKNDLFLATKHNISLFEYFNDLKWNNLDFNKIIHLSQELYVKYSGVLNKTEMIKNDSDSTDTPVSATPYTPYTPYNTPCHTPTPIAISNIDENDYDFESVDFESLKLNNNTINTRKLTKKDEFKKKIKLFINRENR